MSPSTSAVLRDLRLPASSMLAIFDFDGTLASFEADPARVRLPEPGRRLIEDLADTEATAVAILSGRRIADVRARTRIPVHVRVGGLHGLEVERPGGTWRHPDLAAAIRPVAALAGALADVVVRHRGARVEHKQYSVAFHARAVAEGHRERALADAAATAAPYLGGAGLREQRGAAVVEYLPTTAWNKGDAVRLLREDTVAVTGSPVWCLYIGDDLSDEDAFRALGPDDLGVVVGTHPSAARARLGSVADVYDFVDGLRQLRS